MTRVRYYGHVGTPTGYGIAGAEMCMAMLDAGLELEISTTGTRLEREYLPLLSSIKNEDACHPEPDAVILHTLPLDCPRLLDKVVERGLPEATKRIAYTTWEGYGPALSIAPAFQNFHQVWAPSGVTRISLARGCDQFRCAANWEPRRPKFHTVPHAYDVRVLDADPPRERGAASPYRFYYIGAWNVRKNPEGVVRAYLRAFTRDDDVELVIHSVGAPPSAVSLAVLAGTGRSMDDEARIVFSTQELTSEGIRELHRRSDCFVSASRGEAWNIPAFDAMLHRNHIIVPVEQGTNEFLDDTSAELVDSANVPATGEVRLEYDGEGACRASFMGSHGLDVRSLWHDPDLGEMAELMRAAYVGRPRLDLDDEYDPAERFGRAAVGRRIRALIEGDPR